MKKIFKKFWGVALVVMMLSSLFVFVPAAPAAAADPLTWNFKIDEPSAAVWGLAPGTDILSFAVDSTGMTMYAAVYDADEDAYYLLQSTSGGAAWNNITARLNPPAGVTSINYIAMAPDDAKTIVVVDATDDMAYITSNGGASFSAMGDMGAITTIDGVAVSPLVTGGIRYIAVFGAGGGLSRLFYYNFGAAVGAWKEATNSAAPWGAPDGDIGTSIGAFAFSPNFASDYIAVAVSYMDGNDGDGTIDLHVLSFNSHKWDTNALGVTNYPVNIYTGTGATVVNKIALVLIPDYDGSDETMRIEFVGASITEAGPTELGGIWRCIDNAPAQKIYGTDVAGFGINSLTTDGTNLVAGSYDTNNVLRCSGMMDSNPTFFGARAMKRIGVDDAGFNDQVIVAFAGAVVFGAKQGDGSAVSKSMDDGATWNDYTLMDSGSDPFDWMGDPAMQAFVSVGTITDIYMTAAGDPWYLVAYDATKTSVFRMTMFTVTRVLCVLGDDDAIIRGDGTDTNVVYVGIWGGTDLYYTADGGLSRWNKRVAPADIQDMVVESSTVVYIGQEDGVNVYKSSNSGFTWGLGVNCGMATSNIWSMVGVGTNNLLIGGDAGGVCYSTDGGATFTQTFGLGMFGGNDDVQVAATGLTGDNYIFASPANSNDVYRTHLSTDFGMFYDMNVPEATGHEVNTGLVLTNGVLYSLSSNGTVSFINRTLIPAIPGAFDPHYWGARFPYTAAPAFDLDLEPSALKVSSGPPGSIMLYGVNTAINVVYYFQDTLALTAPTVTGPADKALIQLTSALLGTSQPVNFTWNRDSLATSYMLWVALDPAFTQLIALPDGGYLENGAPIVSDIVPGEYFTPGTTYYWMVMAFEPLGSPFSTPRSFTIQNVAASVPQIGSPAAGATVDTLQPGFSWSPVSGATSYEFQLSKEASFAVILFTENTTTAGESLPVAMKLDAGIQYYWRVRAAAPTVGDWSAVGNFIVALPASATPPVTPTINLPTPTINLPQPTVTVVVPTPTQTTTEISPAYIWAIIIIGAVLVIAVVVLIVRTRRSV